MIDLLYKLVVQKNPELENYMALCFHFFRFVLGIERPYLDNLKQGTIFENLQGPLTTELNLIGGDLLVPSAPVISTDIVPIRSRLNPEPESPAVMCTEVDHIPTTRLNPRSPTFADSVSQLALLDTSATDGFYDAIFFSVYKLPQLQY
jgi:hypothetical protein